jgi:thiosulfate dehydrogenase (quinone) large subunit
MVELKSKKRHYFWAILRIAMGLIFLWAFFDKLLGLGFTTCLSEESGLQILCDSAWINGGSPTYGFLTFATKGPFATFFQYLADFKFVDWFFMIILLGVGLTLTFGILVRIGSLIGAVLLFSMWLAVLPPEHHPFLDDHIIYIIIMLGFAFVHTCKHLGFGQHWSKKKIVKKYKILE